MRSLAWWLRSLLTMLALLAIARGAPAAEESSAKDGNELDIVPVVGGDSDIGIGGGEFGALTRHRHGVKPYVWRIESGAFVSFKESSAGGVRIPYGDAYFLFVVPHVIPNLLRLEVRPSFTDETTLNYYGVGNASQPRPIADIHDPYYQYGRIHPTLAVRARLTLAKSLYAVVGDSFTYTSLDVPVTSRVSEDRASTDPRLRTMLQGPRQHGVDLFEYSLVFDNRDEETSTHSGHYDSAQLRLSPGGTEALPYRYAQANVTLRAYASPFGPKLTFAARLVGDVIFGDPPFYELPRFDDTYAIGGANGVRGVPAQRYSGKVKVFGNFETRADLVPFRLFAKKFSLGAAAFVDAGRVWADTTPRPDLDGTSLGLKVGVGGGLRLYQGSSFVVRLDVAWSPDATPIGAYFAAGQIF